MRWSLMILLFCLLQAPLAVSASLEVEIREIVDGILTVDDQEFLPAEAVVEEIVTEFYERREYRPAWVDNTVARQVLDLIATSGEHGLDPADYHHGELLALLDQWNNQLIKSNRTRAQFDVLLTDGMLLYASHMIEGKVDPGPLEYSWNYSRRDFLPENVVARVSAAIDEGLIGDALVELAPASWFYEQLKAALAFYRNLEEAGPYPDIPADTVLREGDRHAAVALIRKRLRELDFLDHVGADAELFDASLEQAVEFFQEMHGLGADGVVGANTYAALNTPPSRRIEQIRVNLDRIRWVQDDVTDNFIVVNIAGFELYHVVNEELLWKTDVMTGSVTTETPMFRARIKYLVFNPTWTVPRSIIRRSLYGKFSSNPEYITEANYKLYDRDGAEVDPADLDWSQLSRNNFPYRVVQQPGPGNALGRVKFMFPNKHAIYLHDTPHRELFERSARAFSAGCIRVQYPLQLAERLLADPTAWGRDQIEQVVDGGELQNVRLTQAVDVLLMYWTASPSTTGRVKFHPDIYNRDARVLKRLLEPPVWEF